MYANPLAQKIFGAILLAGIATWVLLGQRVPAPRVADPLEARLELAAGEVIVEREGTKTSALSGTPIGVGAILSTGPGARALARLSDGSAIFLRDNTRIVLGARAIELESGEAWIDAPPTDREPLVHRLGDVEVSGANAGFDARVEKNEAQVYVARGLVTVSSKNGRREAHAGEEAHVSGDEAPQISPVAFWEDWTGGMGDHGASAARSDGHGTIYGVDALAPSGSPAKKLEIARQSVRATIRDGIAETEVDQTFFNPGERAVEGWYWFVIPEGASVTSFALETNGQLVEGELIERREAARQYSVAVNNGNDPALLEWIDGRTYRARIYPIASSGTRRTVLRYIQLLPSVEGRLRYVYPLRAKDAPRIGELSLSVDLGEAGESMHISTIADARIEQNGRLVTMRRSGYVPRADFMLEASGAKMKPLRVLRYAAGGEAADYVMVRYVPDVDWSKAKAPHGDVVVAIDTSGASDEASHQLKVAAVEAILRSLSDSDRFALVSLDTQATVLHPAQGLAPATDEEIRKAMELLAEHGKGGATDLGGLFDVALERVHGTDQPAVVYVGDGIATSGELSAEQLSEKLRRALSTSRARLFTVAIGAESNRTLLEGLARVGGGRALSIDTLEEATSRALELAAALKTPTITELELDAGAGLDDIFLSANGKLTRGEEVVLLARTHHDLPTRMTIHGRVAGEKIERIYDAEVEKSPSATLVPRLWASENLRRMLGDESDQVGKIAQLGIEYGIMTPYTSFLALDSEAAYQQQGIQRHYSPLRGARLALAIAASVVGIGCTDNAMRSPPQAQTLSEPTQHFVDKTITARVEQQAQPKPQGQPAFGSELRPLRGAEGKVGRADKDRMNERRPELSADLAPEDAGGRGQALNAVAVAVAPVACSDAAERPLAERALLWKKRIAGAANAAELVERYRAAVSACELPNWRAESTFLRLLERAVNDQLAARAVLDALRARPEAQRLIARLLLRRSHDAGIVAAVDERLIQSPVRWNEVDLELSKTKRIEDRVEKLEKYVARSPDDPRGVMRLVRLLVKVGRLDEALIHARALRDRGFMSPESALALGDLLADRGLDDEARRTYSELVEFQPGDAASRRALGDVYLAHGWYEHAYREYKTLAEAAPSDWLAWLRLAQAAAGAGRVDEALRLERKVALAEGTPGPSDPRRWAKLESAARLAKLLTTSTAMKEAARLAPSDDRAKDAGPPASVMAKKEALVRELKELQLFPGPGTLVVITWRDPSVELALESGAQFSAEVVDAAPAGLFATLLTARAPMVARLRSAVREKPIAFTKHEVKWDGKAFTVSVEDGAIDGGSSAARM